MPGLDQSAATTRDLTKTVRFTLDRETPGALRFSEVDQFGNLLKPNDYRAVIGTQYLRKLALTEMRQANKGGWPKEIEVTIKVVR